MENKMEYLTKPGKIGKMEVRNRMVMAPMGSWYGTPNGEVTQRVIDYYEERAKGGVGLIIVENTLVHPHEEYGEDILCQLTMWDHNTIPQWNDLVSAVHFWGAKIMVQINYTGYGFLKKGTPGVQPVTASPWVLDTGFSESVLSRGATLEDIKHIQERFAEAAVIAKKAGFDGINIHCTHGYGIAGFQSPYLNLRNDQYGGSFERRNRFGLEILKKIREAVGNDFPLTCRIPVDEFVPEGIHPEESVRIAKKYVEGGVHGVDLSSGTHGRGAETIQSRFLPRAFLEPYCEMYKKEINVPLIVAGSFNDPRDGERVLKAGKADFIALGRMLLADPEYPKKVIEGRMEDIRPCRRCIDGCIHSHREYSRGTDCAVNIECGRERLYRITPAEKPKKVLIVGGGPAGMEAARVASMRGHDVTLFEKGDQLGGNMIPSAVPNFKDEERWMVEWFSRQLKKLGVKIVLKKEVGAETPLTGFDAVVAATGAVHIIPDIPGVEKAVTASDILGGKVKAGKEIILIGGGNIGCETALYLGEKGCKVTILEMLDDIALDVDKSVVRPPLLERMAKSKITWFTGIRVAEVFDGGVVGFDSRMKKRSFNADTVILAVGLKSVNELVQVLKEKIPECYAVGDCVEPRKVFQAIHEGAMVGRRI